MQPSQARKQHVRPRDQESLARELRQQLIPCHRSRSRVAIENHRDFGMLQLDALYVNDVAPKQDCFSLGRKFIAGMSEGVAMQRDDLHAVNDVLRVAKRVPLAGLDVWRCDALRSLKKRLPAAKRTEFFLCIFDLLTTDEFMNLGWRHPATTQRTLL
jgi:hypothetical protein